MNLSSSKISNCQKKMDLNFLFCEPAPVSTPVQESLETRVEKIRARNKDLTLGSFAAYSNWLKLKAIFSHPKYSDLYIVHKTSEGELFGFQVNQFLDWFLSQSWPHVSIWHASQLPIIEGSKLLEDAGRLGKLSDYSKMTTSLLRPLNPDPLIAGVVNSYHSPVQLRSGKNDLVDKFQRELELYIEQWSSQIQDH